MAKIFLLTSGLTGILNASFEMARRLRAAGHEVMLGAPRPVAERVAAEGFSFVAFPEILIDPVPIPSETGGKLGHAWLRFYYRKARRAAALESYRAPEFRAAVTRLDPDLLLIDIELHEYIIAAHALGRNFALLSQWYSTWRRPGLPYLLTDTIPGAGRAGTRDAMEGHWDVVKQERRRMFAKMAFLSWRTDRRSILLALADECGFPRKYIRENWWPGVFTYADLPVVTMTPRELEFPHDARPGLHYVGPMVHETRKEETAISHGGRPLEELLTDAKTTGAKIILCTVSTLHAGDADFLRRLVAAVSPRRDWQLIVGLGGKLQPEALGGLPANVHTFAYVPQLRVLRAADLSVNHAGIHTIHECLHFGVPQLVYSGKRSDQPGCAARVHFHGVGLRADKDLDEAEDIRRKIDEVLGGESYRRRTGEVRQACLNYAKDETLEGVINGFLKRERHDR